VIVVMPRRDERLAAGRDRRVIEQIRAQLLALASRAR
jgi:hypothetical protein